MSELTDIIGIVQRWQPAGSPPPGTPQMLVHWILQSLGERAEKAEAKAIRLTEALRYLQKANMPCSAPEWCEHCFIAGALRPTTPGPTPRQVSQDDLRGSVDAPAVGSDRPNLPLSTAPQVVIEIDENGAVREVPMERPDFPLGHKFELGEFGDRCDHWKGERGPCGLPEAVHQRKS